MPSGRHDVSRVVTIGAAMEFPRGECRAAAAHRADVQNLRARHVACLVPGATEPAAEIGVLPVQEVTLVEPSDGVEAIAAGSAWTRPSPSRPARCRCHSDEIRRRQIAPGHARAREQSGEHSVPSEQSGPGAGLAARARLHAAVGIQQPGAATAHCGYCSSVAASCAKAPGTTRAVRVQQPEQPCICPRSPPGSLPRRTRDSWRSVTSVRQPSLPRHARCHPWRRCRRRGSWRSRREDRRQWIPLRRGDVLLR